ncbi:MAG TPA: TetR/AcrR family transcriptional regulator [Gemmatimonadaceae bacterium]|nr:TetR/AcrR family transcriptional regulator [Gemmatimonadaceae bacterium]
MPPSNDSSRTTDQLLDVAQELAQTRGYNAFSYRDLAERVGIRSASVHHHFPAKGDLGRALVARYRDRFSDALRGIGAAGGGASAKLAAYVELFRSTYEQGGRLCLGGMFAADLPTLPPEVQEQVRGFYADNEAWLTRILDAGRRASELDFEGSPRDAAAALLDGLEGALLAARAHGSAARFTRASRWLLLSLGARS